MGLFYFDKESWTPPPPSLPKKEINHVFTKSNTALSYLHHLLTLACRDPTSSICLALIIAKPPSSGPFNKTMTS